MGSRLLGRDVQLPGAQLLPQPQPLGAIQGGSCSRDLVQAYVPQSQAIEWLAVLDVEVRPTMNHSPHAVDVYPPLSGIRYPSAPHVFIQPMHTASWRNVRFCQT